MEEFRLPSLASRRAAPFYIVIMATLAACSRPGPSGGSAPPQQAASYQSGGPSQAPGQQVPAPVKNVLQQYVGVLRSTPDLDDCARRFTPIAGGSLVNEDGSLRRTVPRFSLKKDHQNVRFYADPIQITRVDVRPNQSSGFGPTAIRGTHYKIWIAKAPGQPGMPAPISLLVPQSHPTIRGPRVIGIGSL